MTDRVLRLEAVTKDYGREVVTRVLYGIDLELRTGEFAALVGPSGSGKSTLLNLLGLLDRPSSGRIFIRENDTSALDDRALTTLRAESIGFVFQFHHLIPALTAAENVMMPLAVAARRLRSRMHEQAVEMLGQVGLAERAGERPSRLSGGQQQRVAVARALVMRPPLVLADEPTGNLDTHTASEVFDLLRRFNQEQKTAFLIVTHDFRMAERCDRIIELVDGRVRSDVRR